ncbi:MAG: hypothetical protein MPW15_14350 [Candidatus Manganitrophus sp.]|nr:hypothetical protein [Candidatus Manganitrophus sp.]
MRITQLYVAVGYGPVRLQNSIEAGYINDGVSPNLGKTTTSFKFKTVYYQVNNVAPAADNPKVHIDGNATGIAMTLDATAAAALRDGNYTNGEQYIYTATLAQGTHNYYFSATDGTNTARIPAGTATFSGPDVALNGGAPNLAPSGKVSSTIVASTGWTFCNATPTCSTNGSTGYTAAEGPWTPATAIPPSPEAPSTATGSTWSSTIRPPSPTPSQLLPFNSLLSPGIPPARQRPGSTLDCGSADDDYLSGTTKTPPDAYGAAIAGAVYTTNPATGENWTWNDIKGMRAVIVHQTNANEIRVTQLYLTVTYSPIQLTFSTDPRYFDDGVDPNGGITTTQFNYRIVYTQAYGLAPAAGYPKVHIDGSAGGVAMILDTDAPAELQDGDYTNGEQYKYTTTLSAQGTPHNYYFDVSDGTNTMRTPLSGTLSGPVVSAGTPTLSFASQTGYALEVGRHRHLGDLGNHHRHRNRNQLHHPASGRDNHHRSQRTDANSHRHYKQHQSHGRYPLLSQPFRGHVHLRRLVGHRHLNDLGNHHRHRHRNQLHHPAPGRKYPHRRRPNPDRDGHREQYVVDC